MSKSKISVYRIFLSSTAIDLREHRRKASDALLRLGDLPVGMETFGAMPNEPVQVCQDKARSRAALQNAREALDRSQHPDCQYAWGEADGLHLCGICHQALGEPELARRRLEAALDVRQRIQHPGANETRRLLEDLQAKP